MSAMWEPLRPQALENDLGCYRNLGAREKEPNAEPWFKSIFNTVLKYKNEIFGGQTPATIQTKQQRVQDNAIPVNYKFIFALFADGFYRPGAIVGKNKKQHEFVVYFYHNKKCCFVKRKDMVLKHGNLIEKKAFFCQGNQRLKAKVFGNNSPVNDGFPSIFYLKKKDVWYKVPFKAIFLSKKMIHKCNLDVMKKKSDQSIASSDPAIPQTFP